MGDTLSRTPQTGARLRARRLAAGISQAALAREAGISAAYLNLIEHDHRRIGGKLLNRIAEILGASPSAFTDDRARRLAGFLADARHFAPEGLNVETSDDGFAAQYPGWAELLAARHFDAVDANARAENAAIQAGSGPDPALTTLLHEFLSAASAVRSVASILNSGDDVSAEWQGRFLRSMDEDSARLASGAEALSRWLEAEEKYGSAFAEMEADRHLAAWGYRFPSIEAAADNAERQAAVAALLQTGMFESAGGRWLTERWLQRIARDAARLPANRLAAALEIWGEDVVKLAEHLDLPSALILRRLVFTDVSEQPGQALLVFDQSGGLVLARPRAAVPPPWQSPACPLLPAFEALRRPYEVIETEISIAGLSSETIYAALAAAEHHPNTGAVEVSMLLRPVHTPLTAPAPRAAGLSCLNCPRPDCSARRTPPNRAWKAVPSSGETN